MMLRKTLLSSMALLILVLSGWGCSKSPEGGSGGASTTAGKDSATANGKTDDGTPKGPDIASVPADVKHEGYQYYGLDRGKPIEYEVRRSDTGDASSGTATTRLVNVNGGVAGFTTERTGALSELGAEEVEARKDGIYNVRIGGKAVEPAQLVMPADLPPGKKWATKSAVDLDTGRVEEQLNFNVAGIEKVKTKAGEFDALKIAATGEFKVGTQIAKADVTAWYVKGVGTVKMSIVRKDPSGKPLTMTVEATKVD